MTDPRVLSALLVISAFVAALIVVTYKIHRARASRMSRSELQALGEAADRAERPSSLRPMGGP